MIIRPDEHIRMTILDLETTIKNRGDNRIVGEFAASPFHPDNRIVMGGWLTLEGKLNDSANLIHEVHDDEVKTWDNFDISFRIDRQLSRDFCRALKNSRLIIGQNIRFDLHYIRGVIERELGTDDFFFDLLEDTLVWDSLVAEYELLGQSVRMPGLDLMSERRGLPYKDDAIAEYWKEGIDTEDIPEDELRAYQKADVAKTAYIALDQIREAQERGMFDLMTASMEGALATADAEYNGMKFNVDGARRQASVLEKDLEHYETKVREVFEWAMPKHTGINPGSDQQLSKVLFGGEYKYKVTEPVRDESGEPTYAKTKEKVHDGYYKNGRPKYKSVTVPDLSRPKTKKVEYTDRIEGVFEVEDSDWFTLDGTVKTNDDDVLPRLKKQPGAPDWAYQLIEDVLQYRGLAKDLKTYYKGYCSLTWPHDGKIHPSINHAIAATSRLSVSQPNLQNVSKDKKG